MSMIRNAATAVADSTRHRRSECVLAPVEYFQSIEQLSSSSPPVATRAVVRCASDPSVSSAFPWAARAVLRSTSATVFNLGSTGLDWLPTYPSTGRSRAGGLHGKKIAQVQEGYGLRSGDSERFSILGWWNSHFRAIASAEEDMKPGAP